jgi:hypothetical protein
VAPYFQGEFDRVERLARTTLADVIRRNTGITNLQENVFFFGVPEDDDAPDAERLASPPAMIIDMVVAISTTKVPKHVQPVP